MRNLRLAHILANIIFNELGKKNEIAQANAKCKQNAIHGLQLCNSYLFIVKKSIYTHAIICCGMVLVFTF